MLNNLEQWKKIIVSLPDEEFFSIMRNYLGELKTPFNKHILTDRLLSFLTKEETVERIISLIGEKDAYFLTLIYFLDEPDIKTLYNFLRNEKSFLEVQHIILNLEERLLIFKEPETERIRLSPIFRDTLKEKVLDTRLIFPFETVNEAGAPVPWMNEALLTALVSFINFNPDIFKLDGELKKRPKENIAAVFPDLLSLKGGRTKLEITVKALSALNILKNERGRILISYEHISDFINLPAKERYGLILAASAMDGENPGINDIIRTSDIITSFLDTLPENKGFCIPTLTFLLETAARTDGIDSELAGNIIRTLSETGFLYRYKEDRYVFNPHVKELMYPSDREEPDLIIQSSFSITAKPWINLRSGLPLALSSLITKYDLFSHYEINKRSFLGIRRIKMNYKDLVSYLEKASKGPVPQNISASLEHWAQEYDTIQLYEGTILVVSESRQVIIDHIESLKPYIKLHPAPNVYILSPEEEGEWSRILLETGIPVLPEVKSFSAQQERISHFEAADEKKKHSRPRINFIDRKKDSKGRTPDFIPELHSALEKKKLSDSELEEMNARIGRKLILFPDQIQSGVYRKEITEVGGLDYTGKLRLIHRAMERGTDILEIKSNIFPEDNNRILIKPVRINNENDKHILHASTLPEEEELAIPVGKISHIKLLKSSLYAPVSG